MPKKSNHGFHVGEGVNYTYRSAKHPHGTIIAVHPGTTLHSTTVRIRPAKAFQFGEGTITRHADKIHHRS